ncbi:methyl-accepting chemotaxis protein [Pusillimonas sp. MFBS29]|uniref:methyl-accepting chemotaxis protein n=1 Tax=Pusillimonas sp. MFBS29 TaxID=2886690 RepID=UPI001D1227FB|nr:methyl-accepting chemotaxis protein [Pusillimonas sp. MFBS29]
MHGLSNLTVRTKITLGFLIVATIAAIIGAVSIWSTQQVRQMALLMYHQEVAGLRHAAQAQNNVVAAGRALRSALLATDKGQRIGDVYFMRDFIQAASAEIEKFRVLVTTEQGKASAEAAASAVDAYGQAIEGLAQELEQAAMETVSPAVLVRLQAEAKPLGDTAEMMLSSLMLEKQNSSGELAARTDHIYTDTLRLMLVLTLSGALLAIALGIMLTSDLRRQLGGEPREVARVANTIAGGDLTADINVDRAHQQSVIRAMSHMQDSLRNIVQAVRENSEHVAAGSHNIVAANADLSVRTDEQAAQLTETAAAMEQLAVTVKNNADDAVRASNLALAASDATTRGGEAVQQVVATMNAINASSARINDITSIIDGISFQTNILALNAAVEAACAGTHGRGFAVVASEVRSLAQKSAQAAKDIKALIEDSDETVKLGTKLAQDTGSAMSDIVAQIKGVTALINAISVATLEQRTGIEQVNTAVMSLSMVTGENAASVDSAAKAAAQLNRQADHLVELVGGFTIGDKNSSADMASTGAQQLTATEIPAELSDEIRTPLLGLAA